MIVRISHSESNWGRQAKRRLAMKKSQITAGLIAIIVITALVITGCAGEPTTTPTTQQPTTTQSTTTAPTTTTPTTTKPTPTDTTAPTVTAISPAKNATGIMVNTNITATFSEAMNATTITTGFTLKDENDDIVNGTVTYTGTTATFTPASDMDYSTTYTATITKVVKDKAGNAMSADYVWNFTTRDAGILEGAINYTGQYPTPADVTYTDANGQIAKVTAYPGQVQVFFDAATSLAEAETSIQASGGTIIGKIPLTGYYLVQVPEGTEANFTAAIQQDSHVKLSLPNLALAFARNRTGQDGAGQGGVWQNGVVINEDFITKSIPIPLDLTGAVAIDAGAHAQAVVEASQLAGDGIKNVVDVSSVIDDSGYFSSDKSVLALTAIAQGNSIFHPDDPVYVNMSYNGGSWSGDGWVDYTTLSTDEQKQAILNCENDLLSKFLAVDGLPDPAGWNMVLSQSAGDCNMSLDEPLQEIRWEFPGLVPTIRDNFTIYATGLGDGSNYATGDIDVVTLNNPQAANGTSFSSAAGLGYAMHTANEVGGLTPAEASITVKIAEYSNASGELNIDEALEVAKSVRKISTDLIAMGATEEQAITAMWLAVMNNADRLLFYSEASDMLASIQSEMEGNYYMAAYVTNISIDLFIYNQIESEILVKITPSFEGVLVGYEVRGTDGYNLKGQLTTDQWGEIEFTIRSGPCEITYTFDAWIYLNPRIKTTKTHFWYW